MPTSASSSSSSPPLPIGQLVAEASTALATPESLDGRPAPAGLATLAAYVRQARSDGSDLRAYTDRWRRARSAPAGDQVRHALRHLVDGRHARPDGT
jgi:hypothetical protein